MATPSTPSGSTGPGGVPPVLPSIPLNVEPDPAREVSVGGLVREATTHVSTLVRAEVELARTEITAEVKKGLQGSLFFIIALTIVLFSLFFGFFALAELIALPLNRPAAFAIVFGFMLLVAGLLAFLGYRRVKKLRKPERTISSLRDSAQAITTRDRGDDRADRRRIDGSVRAG